MTQYLEAKIVIPEDYVIITKVEYERFILNEELGRWWTLKDVMKRVNRGRTWLIGNLLNHPKYRKKIDVKNGGFVKYPVGGKDSYLFLASETKKFLEENFSSILK
ncbi:MULTISPECIES: DUF771 domain-containing protein [Enterococcus]|uniref:DUF771 domain-containing protein n=1 Tax=Enterococcus TaxID=1350 RepID=UPI001559D56C|nr:MULTISPECIES: DUF771 domain-containing protein [Enterococcus]MDK4449760.1 DUF771 domain-containing protein [Enterococcus casseliflavus]MDV7690052.1 DUF771 domain-containing protein [Enterococcus casseliflavus]MDY2550910.1 DUF771 domain-containing protein [Enterococcus casseliflavus]NQE02721.1 DUF771 domain-containing protein [Enterococcus gallinarum]